MNFQAKHEQPTEIRNVIERLRSRIRAYVWMEGIAAAIIWSGLTFWIGLALDYLPVLVGSSEMPRTARLVLLVVVSVVLLYIIYRWILRRAFARLADKSLALLIERRFPDFQDSLVTTVEFADSSESEIDPSLLLQTRRSAVSNLGSVRLGEIFNFRPLIRSSLGAVTVAISVALFAAFASDAFATWANRFYLLSDDPWPRRSHIEVIGFNEQSIIKVAEGDDITIRVRADATRETPPPEVCTIYYRLDNGGRGSANMSKDGAARDGFQHYSFASTPFKGMLEGVEFDVVGFDHRVSGLRIEVVPSPTVIGVTLRSELPAYTGLLPRNDDWSVASRLPIGSRIQVTTTANKPLERIELTNVSVADEIVETIEPDLNDARVFTYLIDNLSARIAKNIVLYDQDGIVSQQPFRLTIGAIADQSPEVSAQLIGIGDAVTPDVTIPLQGTATDDYAVASTWFNVAVTESPAREGQTLTFPIEAKSDGTIDARLDFRAQRNAEEHPVELAVGERMSLTIQSADRYNLGDAPNVGVSEEFTLRVVEPSELLALLEADELRLRRRFEQTIAEVTEMRDMLARVQTSDEEDETERDESLRVLRIQRVRQQGDKSTQEIEGVAAAFLAIRDELINNRIDTEERKIRLEQQIAEPLKDIVDLQFPDWDDSLKRLISAIESDQAADELAEESVRLTDEILLAMQRVLQKMEELESYNELVDLVRAILQEQDDLLEKTKQERKNQAKSLLE